MNPAATAGDLASKQRPADPSQRPGVPGTRQHNLLRYEGVWRHWGRGSKRRPVLRDLTLELEAGSVTLVNGSNGAGKTTLLRIATGILAPDAGTVTLDGLSPERSWREYHRRLGFLSAGDRGLYPRVNVVRHLRFVAAQSFVPRDQRDAAVSDALARFGLDELAGRRADRLSHGQRQRLRLALALVHRPKVLLLDEPRNGLDGDGVDVLAAAVGRVVSEGGLVLCCAPAGEDQGFPFDRRYVVEDGRLVAG